MNAMKDFNYEHDNMIVVRTSLGKVELRYQVREQVEKDSLLTAIFGEFPEHEEEAMNKPTYFKATLFNSVLGSIHTEYGWVPEEAIKKLYIACAIQTMCNEDL